MFLLHRSTEKKLNGTLDNNMIHVRSSDSLPSFISDAQQIVTAWANAEVIPALEDILEPFTHNALDNPNFPRIHTRSGSQASRGEKSLSQFR